MICDTKTIEPNTRSMKKLFVILIVILAHYACEQKELTTYEDGNYVFFDETIPDTVLFSFFYYIEDVVDANFVIALTGLPLMQEKEITLRVNKEESDCPEALYQFRDRYLFSANQIIDTIGITFTNSEELKTKEYVLVLEIESNDVLKSHNGKNGRRVIKISDIAQRPAWWTENPIEWFYLGTYSRKKYELFLQVTGEGDLSDKTPGEIRILTLQFQHWLDSQNPKIVDEDGNVMKTEIIG